MFTSHMFLALVLALCVIQSFALFEDQAGNDDWMRKQIGHVTFASFFPNNDNIVVGSSDGVLATLNGINGDIVWRQVLSENESIDELVHEGKFVWTRSGNIWRLWFATSGELVFETSAFSTVQEPSFSTALFIKGTNDMEAPSLLLRDNTLFKMTLFPEKVTWKWSVPETHSVLAVSLRKSSGYVCAEEKGKLVVFKIDLSNGNLLSTISFPSTIDSLWTFHALKSGHIIMHKPGSDECVFFDSKNDKFQTMSFQTLLQDNGSVLSISVSGKFVKVEQAKVSVLLAVSGSDISGDNAVRVMTSVAKAEGCVLSLRTGGKDGDFVGTIRKTGSSQVVSLENTKTKEMITQTVSLPEASIMKRGFAWKNGNELVVLAVDCSHQVSMIKENQLLWYREEALASITSAQFVSLPPDSFFEEKEDSAYPGFFERVLPEFHFMLTSITEKFLSSFADKQENQMKQDHFGFRKLIVVLTAPGKLFAINTKTGAIMWKFCLCPSKYGNLSTMYNLGHHHAVVFSRAKDDTSFIHYFDPISGQIHNSVALSYSVEKTFLAPFEDEHQFQSLIVVDSNKHVHFLGSTAESAPQVNMETMKGLYYFDDGAHSLQGYSFQVNDEQVTAVKTWNMIFPEDVETISSVARHNAESMIQTAVQPIGGGKGGYLVRYLNPNLIAVATVRNTHTDREMIPSVKRTTDPCIYIYLIDSVSGRVLERVMQKGGFGPVHIVHSENMIVYHFWNNNEKRYEVSVLELYEDEDAYKGMERPEYFSSFSAPNPRVVQQTFVLEAALSIMAVSQTHKSITSKEVLFGLKNGQLLGMEKKFLDTRRPLGDPTAHEKTDMLVPYMRELPIQQTKIASYSNTIYHMRGIESSGAVLESPSLVFAYGLDSFFAHVTPSGSFDLLSEEFNYPMLVLTVAGVAVALLVSKRAAQQKELKEKWL